MLKKILNGFCFGQNFKFKPDAFVAEILNYEGKGSLQSYLCKKEWASRVGANTDKTNKLFSLFNLEISLTENGRDHLDDVLEATFSYLKLLKLNGPNEALFREIQAVKANKFRFAEEQDSLDNCAKYVASLEQYPPEYILTGDDLYFEYNSDVIQKFVDELNSPKFNTIITSMKPFNDHVTFEAIEPWYGTRYTELDMPTKWIDLWKNVQPFAEFAMPEPNPFITDDFTIFSMAGGSSSKYPVKLLDNDSCELWFRQDDKFLLPFARYKFYLISPIVIESTEK